MAAILDLVNFHRFKELEKNAIPFFLITIMFQKGINKKITFYKHFARKYMRAYTSMTVDNLNAQNRVLKVAQPVIKLAFCLIFHNIPI